MDINTCVMQCCIPEEGTSHFFGLTEERWSSLRGKSFWITGGGTGFGYAMAYAVLSAGATVFISGRRESKLREAMELFSVAGLDITNCHCVVMDVRSQSSIDAACEYVRTKCTSLNGLVHSAGLPGAIGSSTPLQNADTDNWQRVMDTNVRGPWLLTRSIFSHLALALSPKVLFITSGAGWGSTPGVGVYNVSKAALNSLGHSMAQEYALNYPQVDIQMNILVPGEAKSEMNRDGKDSPFTVVSMFLILLSYPKGGPNGRFFHRDGRHLRFGDTHAYPHKLI